MRIDIRIQDERPISGLGKFNVPSTKQTETGEALSEREERLARVKAGSSEWKEVEKGSRGAENGRKSLQIFSANESSEMRITMFSPMRLSAVETASVDACLHTEKKSEEFEVGNSEDKQIGVFGTPWDEEDFRDGGRRKTSLQRGERVTLGEKPTPKSLAIG